MNIETNINNLLIKPVLTRAIHVQDRKEFIIPAHQHFDYELIYSLNGKYECDHNGRKHLFKVGEGLLNCPGDWHTDILHQDVHYIAINFVFQDNVSKKIFSSLVNSQEKQLLFNDKDESIKATLEKLISENNKMDKFSTVIQEALLMEMFWQLIRLLPTNMLNKDIFEDTEKTNFKKKLELIFQQYIHESLSLQQMAACLYMTPRTLSNYCHRFLGISPVRAFIKFKMEHAMKLTSQTDMSIKEISEYLGFSNPYHFSKVFKRTYFTAPNLLRMKI